MSPTIPNHRPSAAEPTRQPTEACAPAAAQTNTSVALRPADQLAHGPAGERASRVSAHSLNQGAAQAGLVAPILRPLVIAAQHEALMPPVLLGYNKTRVPSENYIDAVGLRVIHLVEHDGVSTRYLMTEAQNQGSYGKVKFGYDGQYQRVALKEMRLVGKHLDALSKFGLPKTLPMSYDDVRGEAARTAMLRAIIDSVIAASIALRGGHDALGNVRSGVQSYQVREVVQMQDKMLMVTTLQSGDLADLQATISPPERGHLALSAAAQVFCELAALHGAGWAHLDVKPENLFFAPNGQIILGDYGLARAVVSQDGHLGVRGPRGTIPVPDMLLTDDELDEDGNWQSVLLTPAADVWAAAMTTLQLMDGGHDAHNPLLYQHNPDGSINHVATSTRLAHFEVWRRESVVPGGQVISARLNDDNIFSHFFKAVHRVQPELCDILLAQALVARLDQRRSAGHIAQALSGVVGRMSNDAQVITKQVSINGHHNLGQEAAYASLDRYVSWFVAGGAG